MNDYDVVIIGSGTGGQTAAYALKEAGLNVAVVEESETPGGICALAGCQAKKWFYEATETVARSEHLKDIGIDQVARGAWGDLQKQKSDFTAAIPDSTINGFYEEGIEYLEGTARFVDADTLDVDGEKVGAAFFVVATGAKPMPLPIAGMENVLTSNDFLELTALPARIVFIGGGFISFEFSHFAARLGPENKHITILEAMPRPLGPFDAEMVGLLTDASGEAGIEILTDVKITSVENSSAGYKVNTENKGEFQADLVVHGAGRAANIESLNLADGKVDASPKGIIVDQKMQTSNRKVFAVGDCAATVQLARVADYEGYVVARNILARLKGTSEESIDYDSVPSLLFTYPQYGMVGKTEDALKREGVVYRKSFGKNLSWPTYRRIGMKHAAYKVLVGEDGHLLGAHILSDIAGGLINTFKHAMINRIPADELYHQNVMTPYPTRESDITYMLRSFLS
jgi:glutathione reductase (NADPH)